MRRALGLGLLLFALCAARVAQAVPEIDQPAPPLKGTLLSGVAFDLAQMRGKVVMINFYSSYCKFCAYEIGTLEAFYEQHRAAGFEVIAVGVDPPEDRARVERMLGIYNLPGTMASSLEESGFATRYATPTAFIVDRNGVVRHRVTGAKGPTHYRELVLPLLRE